MKEKERGEERSEVKEREGGAQKRLVEGKRERESEGHRYGEVKERERGVERG